MLQLLLRKPLLLRDWIALGHQVANFYAVACKKHQWVLFDPHQVWNIQALQNPKTGETEYWISQRCRCQCCGTVRNFSLVQIIFDEV